MAIQGRTRHGWVRSGSAWFYYTSNQGVDTVVRGTARFGSLLQGTAWHGFIQLTFVMWSRLG